MCSVDFCEGKVFASGLCSRHYQAKRKYGDPTVVKQIQHHGLSLTDRFFRYVGKRSGCWNWEGGKDANGYGSMNVHGAPMLAHRISYTIHKGDIPKGLYILHSCDNPSCVNPDHLSAGTQADNVADMHNKGRARKRALKGESHANSKLTDADVRYIRESKETVMDIAKKLNVSRAIIYDVKARKTWRHIQ
jgi:hypothetical protein